MSREPNKEISQVSPIQRKNILSGENHMCKGPEAGGTHSAFKKGLLEISPRRIHRRNENQRQNPHESTVQEKSLQGRGKESARRLRRRGQGGRKKAPESSITKKRASQTGSS